jgi:hypothetical protein
MKIFLMTRSSFAGTTIEIFRGNSFTHLSRVSHDSCRHPSSVEPIWEVAAQICDVTGDLDAWFYLSGLEMPPEH